MALTDPLDTLSYHLSRPLTQARDMSAVPVVSVVEALKAYQGSLDGQKYPNPETEALTFYGLNHGMACIQQAFAPLEPLPPAQCDFVNAYYATLNEKAMRAFYYLLLITTREARHCKSWSSDKGKLNAKFGKPMAEFLTSGSGEQGIHNNLINKPPQTSIGTYCKAIQWAFYECGWPGGYGGPAWGKVTDCLVNFVTGAFTAEMMLDTIWTLCHNNGPIFNKGHLYEQHSTPTLIRILDVQRSGQIPQAIPKTADPFPVGCESFKAYTTPMLQSQMAWVRDTYSLPGHVDWYLVEALGAVKQYSNNKIEQTAKYGPSKYTTEADKIAAQAMKAKLAAQAEAEAKLAKEKAEWDENHVTIYPGLVVEKIKRAA